MLIFLQFLHVFSQEITWTNYSFAFPQFIPLIAEKTVFSRTFEEFGQILNISIEYNGEFDEPICNFDYQYMLFQRQPDTLIALVTDLQQIDIDSLKTEEIQQGFSDELISFATIDRNLILLEKNGTIHHLYYNDGPALTNYTVYQLSINQGVNEYAQILSDTQSFYYVDSDQFVKFNINNGSLEEIKIHSWNKVNDHFKIFVRQEYVYLINGISGMSIYKMQNNILLLVNKFMIQDIYQSPGFTNLNLIDYSIDKEFLYLLDHENGVKRFNLTSMHIDKNFFISQKGCKVISVQNNQIILIQQNQLFSEIYEGRIFNDSWVLIRKKTATKQIYRNIKQFDNYTLLISNPTNNMYQKNLIENFSDPYLYNGDNFYQMEFLGLIEMDTDFVVGIYKYGVAIYYVQEKSAQISCQARLSQQNRVTIRLNSTNCLNKNQSDIFNYCQCRLDYVFDVHGVLMSPYQENLYIYFCVVAFAIVVALFVAIFLIIRRYQLKKEKIDHIRKSRRTLSY
ncbi:unnamed protein product (macronuclear) [Paramecium tetraurelia]|uniref:Transmembrane protein n=1 Tax=Paramecium tetraurelia TaxID=5888 RepID=A0DE45_PARTE|nr:uncharacterized protein GSPATT00016154001 [Paramecium tetraurelia]CAK81312.1 unnamed protein product [Paramecium tetraurelia]|eukprot:XP_001448709.1 hypothetical protein (macronuclear) [Paramecium tetraurelia strain d4-2]